MTKVVQSNLLDEPHNSESTFADHFQRLKVFNSQFGSLQSGGEIG